MAHTPRPGPDPILRDQRIAELEAAQPIDHRPLLGRIDALEAENERLANNNEALESDDKKLRDFIAELEAELVALREELDSHDDYTLCDCCHSLTLEPIDAGGHMQCVSCTELAELAELRELLSLIRDDLRMRSEDGVVDISDFIWMRMDRALLEVKDAPEAPRIKQDWQADWERGKRSN